MADSLYVETALSDSFIYGEFNRNSEFMGLLINAMKKSMQITEAHIVDQIMQIERTRISPLVSKVIQSFKKGEIVLMYAEKEVRVPQSVPFIVTRTGNNVRSIVFLHNYSKLGKPDLDGTRRLDISYKDLYAIMEASFIAHNYNVYNNRLTRSMGLAKMTCSVYTNMLIRIMNKAYSIMNDFDLYDKITFCIGKFYLERIWMSTNEEVNFSYAISNVKETNGGRGINMTDMMTLNEEYSSKEISTIDDLIKFISELSPRLKGITTRIFFQTYINTYKTASIFGLEVLPYFLFIMEAAIIGSYIVNRDLVMDVMKLTKGVTYFYPELVKVII